VDDLIARAARAYVDLLALGHTETKGPGIRLVSWDRAPQIYDANFACDAIASEPGEARAGLDWFETACAERGLVYRQFVATPATPEAFLAKLALAGFEPESVLQMVLEGELMGPSPPRVEIRRVETSEDRATIQEMILENGAEDDLQHGRSIWSESVGAEMAATKWAKAPALRFWIARVDGADCAHFSSWPGTEGVGIVEDLYTRPAFRGRGIARALIHHCVADARARGAGPLLISADPEDTPARAYARMGFEPRFLTWGWLRRLGAGADLSA
jgi:GNAT superfamily N-acetyltransferase